MAYINGNNIYFGIFSQIDGGYNIGEATAASTPKTLSVINMGNYYLQSDQFIVDLQDMWDWDDDDALTWGCFTFVKSGNNSAGIQDSYTATPNTYGGVMRISEGGTSPTNVYIAKSNKAIIIEMSGGAVALFSAKDTEGTEHKCVAIARNDSTYNICFAADDGTSANVYLKSNNNFKRVTTAVSEIIPFFNEISGGFVKSAEILQLAALPSKLNGLFDINGIQYYFGNYIALRDG